MKGTDLASGLAIAINDLEKFKADAKDFPQITKTIEDLDKAIANIGDASSLNSFNDNLRVARSELAKIKSETNATNRNEKVGINVSGLQSQIANLQRISPEIDKFEANINGAKVTVQSLLTDLNNVNTQSDFSVINSKWKAFTDSAKSAGIAITEVGSKSESIIDKINNKTYDKQFASLEQSYRNLGLTSNEIKIKTHEVSAALDNLKNKNLDTLTQDEKEFADALKKAQNEATILKTDLDKIYNPARQEKLSNDLLNWLSKNTGAAKSAREEIQQYYNQVQNGRVSVTNLEKIEKALKRIDAEQRSVNKLGKAFKDQWKQGVESFSTWLSASSVVMGVIYKTKEAISGIKELDNILTEISKTSDLTINQLKKLGDTAFDTASKYGKKASDYLTGVQEMYRAGFDNAEEMAELSVLAQSAGDMEASIANDYLMATDAAYDYKGNIEKLTEALDGQNYITNNAAVSMKDMADATSQTASVAAQYGVQIDELSALIAVVASKTRKAGSEVGTALKSILINLQDTTSKPVTETFDALNISMTKVVDGSERLKTPIELIYELADAYNSLPEGDVMRANILNEIGQKRHANALAAILSDVDSLDKMKDLYSQGDGSALREAEKSANNLTGSLNRLSNTWTDTVENIVDSDSLKFVVDLLNGIVSGINKLTESLGSLGSIGLGTGLFASFKGTGRVKIAYPSFIHICLS